LVCEELNKNDQVFEQENVIMLVTQSLRGNPNIRGRKGSRGNHGRYNNSNVSHESTQH
jgi:hypothetical protein